MTLTFIDTHNMVAYLSKSDASEGFEQIIDFINESYIVYALTVNPTVYVSCIKQFWRIVAVKSSNDVTRLQALVDKKKVVVTEATIRDALHLDDAEGIDCLPNEEIFATLARMGYEKPSTKLTFYKAFFSSQWKFLIHTILQSMSSKRTSWNEFSSAMASAVICLATGRTFNFSKYIFESLVRNVDSSSKFYMYPRFIILIIQNQLGDLSNHSTKYTSPALTQKVFANMRMVGKGCSGVETPLFEGMIVAREPKNQGHAEEQGDGNNAAKEPVTAVDDVQSPPPQQQSPPPAQPQGAYFPMSLLQEALDACAALTRHVEHLEQDKVAQDLEIIKLKTRVKKLERTNKVKTMKLRRLRKIGTSQRIESSDDTHMEDMSNQGRMINKLDKDQVEGRQADIYHIDMDHATKVLSMQEDEPEIQEAVEVVTTSKLITEVVAAVSETVSAAAIVQADVPAAPVNVAAVMTTAAPVKVVVPSTRRRRGVVIRDPEEESSVKTPTKTTSKDKGKGILVEESKPIKKKQQVELDEAYARKLQEEFNQDIDWETAIDHVKQRAKEEPFIQRYQVMKKMPQTEAQARRNMMMYLKNIVGFTLDFFKGMYYDDIRPIFEAKFNANLEFLLKSKEQIEEEESREIALINETPAHKAAKRRRLNKEAEDVEELKQHLEIVPNEDDDVYTEATPLARKLYRTFITMLKNFDRDDLETLWNIVKDMFSKLKPNNFSDEYLLSTLKTMFGRPDGQDNVWKDQRSVHGQALVKSWKLLTSLRLQVEEQSEMSLELIRFTRQQLQEGQHN
nr:hypothetical protein [Tanacetum cinerariifolium]